MQSDAGIGKLVRVSLSRDNDPHVGQTGRVVQYKSDFGHKQFGVIFPKATSFADMSWYDAEALTVEGDHNDEIDITFTEEEFRQLCRVARARARSLDRKDLFWSLLFTLRIALIFVDPRGGVPAGYATMADAHLSSAVQLIQNHMKPSFWPAAAINEELLDIKE